MRLGTENANLPAFTVLISGRRARRSAAQRPAVGQRVPAVAAPGSEVPFARRPGAVPRQPAGNRRRARRRLNDDLRPLNEQRLAQTHDPETAARIAQYEMAAGMQTAVPELVDIGREPEHVFELYGDDARRAWHVRGQLPVGAADGRTRSAVRAAVSPRLGSPCQLPSKLPGKCRQVDQPSAALVRDLKQRGLLDDTLVDLGAASSAGPCIARVN